MTLLRRALQPRATSTSSKEPMSIGVVAEGWGVDYVVLVKSVKFLPTKILIITNNLLCLGL
jgi:hypothetical protein